MVFNLIFNLLWSFVMGALALACIMGIGAAVLYTIGYLVYAGLQLIGVV